MKALLLFLAALPVAVLTGALVGWGISTWWANALNVDLADPADWGDDERDWPEVRG